MKNSIAGVRARWDVEKGKTETQGEELPAVRRQERAVRDATAGGFWALSELRCQLFWILEGVKAETEQRKPKLRRIKQSEQYAKQIVGITEKHTESVV